jgi:hypothetical protein
VAGRALAAIAIAVCVSTAAASGAGTDPKSDVLRLADLPGGFARGSSHYVTKKAAAKGVAPKTFARFGYVTGYSVDYTRSGSTLGMVKAASDATVYATPAGAHAALQYVEANVKAANGSAARRLSVGARLGNEARLYKVTQKSKSLSVDVFVVFWRSGRILSTVTAAGVSKTVDPAQVVGLAQRQQKHVDGR